MASSKYTVRWTKHSEKQLDKLDNFIREQILRFFRKESLLLFPNECGKPLSNSFNGLHRYRIGDFRAIVKIKNDVLVILVIEIGKRDKVYDN
jgi:mRNA interferase RelE/StbE